MSAAPSDSVASGRTDAVASGRTDAVASGRTDARPAAVTQRPPVIAEGFLSHADLDALAGRMLATGAELIAPAVTGQCVSAAAIASAACLRPGAAPEFVEYLAIDDPARLALGRGMPTMSLKGFFLPQNEALFRWRRRGDRVELTPAQPELRRRVVLGAKPCDAAALEVVDQVMCWDCVDELWQARRDSTVVFTLACPVEDQSCFCTAVGAEPDGVRGADGLLTPVEGGYLVESVTERGRELLADYGIELSTAHAAAAEAGTSDTPDHAGRTDHAARAASGQADGAANAAGETSAAAGEAASAAGSEAASAAAGAASAAAGAASAAAGAAVTAVTDDVRAQAFAFRERARARVAGNLQIDAESVRDWIATHFDDPLLIALGVRCNGCGACSSVCPTCHCFDIVDEPEGVNGGTRRRCWDTCQTGKFTAHASGHNPREDQNVRYRQRINHKFSIYPLRFGEVLCTGCGRCTRSCHAGQDLVEILTAIDIAARRGEKEPADVRAVGAGGAA